MDDEKSRNELRPLFKCPLCREIMADPTRLRICGHIFCHFCLIQHLRKSRTCAQCNRQCNAGHKAYTTDLGLQELAYRCFPDETVQSMRKKFDLAASKKPIAYQLCAANLIYLLQHHISVKSEKVRLRICLTKKRIVSTHRSDNSEMIMRCGHDIPMGTIKKLFARKFQLSASLLNLFSSDTLSLDDSDTVGDLVLQSGGFDLHCPVVIYACLRDEDKKEQEIEATLPPLEDDMPILELESYEADAPSPLLPILEPELPTTSAQAFEPVNEQIPLEQTNPIPDFPSNTPSTPTFDQKTSAKRKAAFEEVKTSKIRKTNSRSELLNQSPTTPNDFMAFFNYMSSAAQQQRPHIPSPNAQPSASTTSSIFAPTNRSNNSEPTIFNNKTPTFPFMSPEIAMAFQYQMFANGPAALKQKPPAQMPQMFPSFTSLPVPQNNIAQLATLQKSMVDAQHYNEFWTRFIQMNGQAPPKVNVKKPGATVKPMRREPYKPSPTTPTEQRPDKNGSVDYKESGNGGSSESDHLHHYLTCAKI